MGIAVLGPISVDSDAVVLGRRDRVVLAALAIRPGDMLSLDQLSDALWGAQAPASASKVLQGCVVRLRKVLGTGAIETLPQGYRLRLMPHEVDAQRFEASVGRARELMAMGEAERASYLLAEALQLWRGRPLVDLENWEVGRIEAGRLVELRLDAEELRVEAELRLGNHVAALSTAHAMVQAAPLRERRWGLLALAQYQAGRQGEALRTLRQVRSVLLQELGLDPGPDLLNLEQAILRQDPTLIAETALAEASDICPYRGLAPYGVNDSDGYFGRDEQVEICLRRLAVDRVLVVTGPSGSGKSSLIRAGVASALRRSGERVIVVTPGRHPADVVPAVLGPSPPVLVVDQCEEVFSLCSDPDERARFLAALVAHAEVGRLVISLRADRLGDVSAYPDFAVLVEKGLHVLVAMGADDLRAAIEGPARQAGLRVEAGLVDLLIAEVENEPGALPLMSHVLRETWQRRTGRTLTIEGYRSSGGVRDAVALSAEDLYQRAGPDLQPLLRDLLLRLVAPGAEGEPIPTRVPRRLVATDDEHSVLVDQLVESRLLTTDTEAVGLAHEALVRAWPRLRSWLDEDVEGQRILHHLAVTADAWESLARPDSELYRGVRLARAEEWRNRTSPGLTETERSFLDHSRGLADSELRDAEERARHQTMVNRRLRGLLAVVAVLLLVSASAGLYAARQTSLADSAATEAQQAATSADARRLGAKALVTGDISLAMLLAVRGHRLDPSPQTQANLLAALARRPELIRSVHGHGGEFTQLAVSPDGTQVTVQDSTNRLWAYSASDGTYLASYASDGRSRPPDNTGGPPLAYSPVDPVLAVGMQDFDELPVRLLDATTLRTRDQQLGGLPSRPSRAVDIAYSRNGRYLAASFLHFRSEVGARGDTSASVSVWRLSSPDEPVLRLSTFPGWVSQHVALSNDGSRLYTSEPLRMYDVPTGRLLRTGNSDYWLSLDLSPDGRLLALPDGSGGGRDVLLVDARTLEVRRRLTGPGEQTWNVRFSHDGTMLAASSLDRTVTVWDVGTGEPRSTLNSDDGWVLGLGFSTDDKTLFTAGRERALRMWDITGNRRFLADVSGTGLRGFGTLGDPRTSPDGAAVAFVAPSSAGERGARLTFVDLRSGERSRPVDTGHLVWSFGASDWHPAGRLFATAGGDGVIRVWDRRTGSLVREKDVGAGLITGLDYSQDGRRIAYAEQSGRLSMVDSGSLAPAGRSIRFAGPLCCVAAASDGRSALVLLGDEGSAAAFESGGRRWAMADLVSGRLLDEGPIGFEDAYAADVAPDGRHIAVGGRLGALVIIDTTTGQRARPPVVGHDDGIIDVDYDDTGGRVVSAGADGTASVWQASTGDLLGTAAAPERDFVRTQFLPDSTDVLITSTRSGVFRWHTDIDRAVDFACRVAGRDLTQSEWRENLGDLPYEKTCPAG